MVLKGVCGFQDRCNTIMRALQNVEFASEMHISYAFGGTPMSRRLDFRLGKHNPFTYPKV